MSKRRKTEIDIFVESLKRQTLTNQQIKTLRGQALAGDLEGASKGLAKIIKQNSSKDAFVKRCTICGKTFTTIIRNQKYCCEVCKHTAHDISIKRAQTAKKAVKKAKRGMEGITTGILDEKLTEAKNKGLTYAELQKQRTLELIKKGEI